MYNKKFSWPFLYNKKKKVKTLFATQSKLLEIFWEQKKKIFFDMCLSQREIYK